MHVYIVLLMAKKSTYVFLCVAITKQLYLTFLLTFDAGHICWRIVTSSKGRGRLLKEMSRVDKEKSPSNNKEGPALYEVLSMFI